MRAGYAANPALVTLQAGCVAVAFSRPAAEAITALSGDSARLPDRALVWLRIGGEARFVLPRPKRRDQ